MVFCEILGKSTRISYNQVVLLGEEEREGRDSDRVVGKLNESLGRKTTAGVPQDVIVF